MKRETFKSFDGAEIGIAIWDEVQNPIGVVQIVHGMAEHIGRYDDLAKLLNANGMICAGGDHRGHGLTAKGVYGKYNGADIAGDTLRDQFGIAAMLKERYNLPLAVFGHSYGSFLTQAMILEQKNYSSLNSQPDKSNTAPKQDRGTAVFEAKRPVDIAGFILCGSAYMGGPVPLFGRKLANWKVRRGRADEAGSTFEKLTFISYDKKLKEGKSAWISHDKEIVRKYNADPMCAFACSNGFYKSFFALLKETVDRSLLEGADKDTKIHIIAGGSDFVGGRGKLVKKLVRNYAKYGFGNVTSKIYPGFRHELHNEIGKEEVYGDIKEYLGFLFEHSVKISKK